MSLLLDNAFDRQKEAMRLSALSHNQLIRLLGNEPRNNGAWEEFVRRYRDYLAGVIKRECQKLEYKAGLSQMDDLLQEIYVKLFKNEGAAFRTYRGQFENTIWQFLEIVAVRVVLNHKRKTEANKRPRITRDIAPNRIGDVLDLFPDKNAEDETNRIMMMLAIEECLQRTSAKLRHPVRDLRIFKLYLYDGLSAESIAELPEIKLSQQSVFRILADLKERLAHCLGAGEQ
jgi:RNA polymerase sigma factor (sigma-70 family)